MKEDIELKKEDSSSEINTEKILNLQSSNSNEKEKEHVGFNGLTAKEWAMLSRSVWSSKEVSSPRQYYHLEHGATFSEALASRLIKIYSKVGDTVFDPFSGVGTTLLASRKLERYSIGFELYEKYFNIIERLLSQSVFSTKDSLVKLGDCRILIDDVEDESVQLTLTSPPYADFIQRSVEDRKNTHKKSKMVNENNSRVKPYGDDSRDFGNLPYTVFMNEVEKIMLKIFRITKPGGYNIWIVKDHRDPKNGKPFIDVHSDIANMGVRAGFLYHDLIVWDQNDQRSLVVLGYPSTFYVNINHSFIIVLRKSRK
jgi:DNA modification methylase